MRSPLLALAAALLSAAAAARADEPPRATGEEAPETRAFRYSAYEEDTLRGALAALGLERDDAPEGKVVGSVHAVRLEVIEERDPAPRFLNALHALSRERVILREVLLRPGDRYARTLADETRRNLAALQQLSVVLVVAARGPTPDEVRLVVVTKDVWSLRLNWNIAVAAQGIESLSANPAETNFLGLHHTAGLLFTLLPRSYSVGAQYDVPRILESHVAASADAGLSFDRLTGAREGSFGDLGVSEPLWSTRTPWAWAAGVSWLSEVTRLYRGTSVAGFTQDGGPVCLVASPRCVPWSWRTDFFDAAASVTRSWGWAAKRDVTLGFDVRRSRFALPALPGFDPATVQAFRDTRLPVSEDRVGPFLQVRAYRTDHLRVLDLETLALQEDYRLGAEAFARVYPVLGALGASRTFVGLTAGLAYTAALGDGLARAGVEPLAEVETASGEVRDGSVQATLRLASPRGRAGRVVVDAVLLDRFENHLQRSSSLGGGDRLRGFPSQYVIGSSVAAANAEYRSPALQLLGSVQVGGVAFVDAGDAFERWRDARLQASAGVGARVLFPQLDRVVFRIDVGFPVTRPLQGGAAPAAFFVTFGQAFSLYEIQPRTAISR
ncbi:MAG: BamA/TamA family outer membrane protein [Anaeromyxobacteraceae bacterium]